MPVLNVLMLSEIIFLFVLHLILFFSQAVEKKNGNMAEKVKRESLFMRMVGITLIGNFPLSIWATDWYYSGEIIVIAVAFVLLGIGFLLNNGVGKGLRIGGELLSMGMIIPTAIYNLEGGGIVAILFGLFWTMAVLAEIIEKNPLPWISAVLFAFYLFGCIAIFEEGPDMIWVYLIFVLPALLAVQNGRLCARRRAVQQGVYGDPSNDGELCVNFKTQASAVLKKTLPVEIFLYCITCGVWELIWVYQVSKYLNEATGIEERNPAGCVWLSFLPFYRAYWAYRQALRIETLIKERGKKTEHLSIVAFVAALLCPMLSFVMLQNKIAELLQSEEE